MYLIVKHLHMTLALTSLILLVSRLALQVWRPHTPLGKVWKVVPHINDTVLLGSALYLLAVFWHWQVPLWLGVKLGLLLVYIVLAALALRQRPSACKLLLSALALSSFVGMLTLARLKPF